MKKRCLENRAFGNQVQVGEIVFTTDFPGADYVSSWSSRFNDRTLINVTACVESVIIFAAKQGWVSPVAPQCSREICKGKNNSSYQRFKKYWF